MADLAELAVIGGSGFYEFLEDAAEVTIDTPFGAPSDPVTVGEVAGAGWRSCPATARDQGWDPVTSATLVVIEGQRFSTRAESQWFAAQGWTLVGMTGHPEAVLARELALCYTPLALVTDLDAGLDEGEGVTQAEVFEVFAANIKRLRDLVATIIAALPVAREDDLCAHPLAGIALPS